jgi:hypothetical protein
VFQRRNFTSCAFNGFIFALFVTIPARNCVPNTIEMILKNKYTKYLLNSRIKVGNVHTSSVVGIATRQRTGRSGVRVSRSRWPSGLRRTSVADRLLGLRVRFQPGARMFVLCQLHSKDKKYKRHSQDNQDKEVVQMKYKRIQKKRGPKRPNVLRNPPSLLFNGYTFFMVTAASA